MVNTRAKGNVKKKMCKDELTKQGWWVADVEKTGKFALEHDMYNLFDAYAVKERTPGNEPKNIYVQVTHNVPHTHYKYQEFADKYCCDHSWIEQWVWVTRKGWKVFTYQSHKKKEVKKHYD